MDKDNSEFLGRVGPYHVFMAAWDRLDVGGEVFAWEWSVRVPTEDEVDECIDGAYIETASGLAYTRDREMAAAHAKLAAERLAKLESPARVEGGAESRQEFIDRLFRMILEGNQPLADLAAMDPRLHRYLSSGLGLIVDVLGYDIDDSVEALGMEAAVEHLGAAIVEAMEADGDAGWPVVSRSHEP